MGTVTGLMRPWLVACVIAESIGMTASAGAARGATVLSDGGVAHASEVGFALVVLGGLVEGTALGVLQSRALGGLLGHRGRVRWLVATVLVAGVGWAAGSAPSALAEDSGTGSEPSVLAVLLGAAALGAGMGVFLGAAQGWALRGHARHPWRWITASGSSSGPHPANTRQNPHTTTTEANRIPNILHDLLRVFRNTRHWPRS